MSSFQKGRVFGFPVGGGGSGDGGVFRVVAVGELSALKVFCVAGRIWRPACSSRLGVRSSGENIFYCQT